MSDEAFALTNYVNGFSLFGTRSSVLGNSFNGFNVGYVESLNSYRDEPFFSTAGQEVAISDMVTQDITNNIDLSTGTSFQT